MMEKIRRDEQPLDWIKKSKDYLYIDLTKEQILVKNFFFSKI
jgi:hypothetical protein